MPTKDSSETQFRKKLWCHSLEWHPELPVHVEAAVTHFAAANMLDISSDVASGFHWIKWLLIDYSSLQIIGNWESVGLKEQLYILDFFKLFLH